MRIYLLAFAVMRARLILRPFALVSAFRTVVCVCAVCVFVVSRGAPARVVSVWGITLPFLEQDVSDRSLSTFVDC